MDRQYVKAEQYAQQKGFALRNYFLNCIQKGDWPAIAAELGDRTIEKEMKEALGDDTQFAFRALSLTWAHMERVAHLAGVKEEDAALLYTVSVIKAEKAGSVEELYLLHKDYMRELTHAVADQRERVGKYAIVLQCQRFIQENIYEEISPRMLSEKYGYSTDYLSRLFKQKNNITIAEYIQREKIAESKKLLLHSSLSIADISANLGFCNQSYFTSVFKKSENMTPKQFREQGQSF